MAPVEPIVMTSLVPHVQPPPPQPIQIKKEKNTQQNGEPQPKVKFVSKISQFIERVRIEHIEPRNSAEIELQLKAICSIRNRSRNWYIVEELLRLISNPKSFRSV